MFLSRIFECLRNEVWDIFGNFQTLWIYRISPIFRDNSFFVPKLKFFQKEIDKIDNQMLQFTHFEVLKIIFWHFFKDWKGWFWVCWCVRHLSAGRALTQSARNTKVASLLQCYQMCTPNPQIFSIFETLQNQFISEKIYQKILKILILQNKILH